MHLGSLYGRTLGLVGVGGIGTAVAERALPFGMRMRAFRRRSSVAGPAGVEIVDSITELVASSDHVVIAAPATPATRGLFDDALFAAMKPGAHLVNVARGAIVDQDALRRALDTGRVAMASLDAVEPEPLPAGHWMYQHPARAPEPAHLVEHARRGRDPGRRLHRQRAPLATRRAARRRRRPRGGILGSEASMARTLGDVATRLLFENDRVRVWEMDLAPGERSATHRHDLDYVLVQLEGDRIAADFEPDTAGAHQRPRRGHRRAGQDALPRARRHRDRRERRQRGATARS